MGTILKGVVWFGLALAISGCAGPGAAAGDGLRVVATTTILGDVVANVVGDDAHVEVLLPIGADPHDFQASSRQVAAIVGADLVVANGLGLEEGLEDVLDAAAEDGANVLFVAPRLDPIPFSGGESAEDPHVWLDPLRMAEAAGIVAAELAAIDTSIDWTARAAAYAAKLAATDAEMRSILEKVPQARRLLVTNHDSLGYLADRYGFTVVDVVIPGGATGGDPSSADLAALVATIERAGVPAIFAETTEPTALAEAVAAEASGSVAVVEIFTGSLGEAGSGADTLIEMLLTNARRIADALG